MAHGCRAAFTPEECAALDAVPQTVAVPCPECGKITPFDRGIYRGYVVRSCRNLCGSMSIVRVICYPVGSN